MTELLLSRTHRRRVEELRERVETWKDRQDEATLALWVDDLVESVILAAVETHRIWALTSKELLSRPLSGAAVRAIAQDVLHHLDETLAVLVLSDRLAREFAEQTGYTVERLEELPQATQGVEALRERIVAAIPLTPPPARGPDPERVRQSREEIARGEVIDLRALAERVEQGGPVEF